MKIYFITFVKDMRLLCCQILTLCGLLMLPVYSCAQDDVIASERNELAKLIEQGLWSEIDFENNKVDDYFILTGHEKEWIHLLKQDFVGFFETWAFNEDYYESTKLRRVIRQDFVARYFGVAEFLSVHDSLGIVLKEKFMKNMDIIGQSAQFSSCSDDQKRFVLLYLSYYRYQFDLCNDELLSAANTDFVLQKFEEPAFTEFVIKYESSLARLSDNSMLFGVGMGAHTLLQKPSNLRSAFVFNFLFDYNWNKFFLGTRLLIQQHRARVAFVSKPEYDENRPIGLFYFDVCAGYNQAFYDAQWLVQPYLGYGFGFYRGLSGVDEPNFPTMQVNSGFFGMKTQYAFSRKRACPERILFVNQQHYAFFFDVSYRVNPFGRSTAELLGRGLLINAGLVINTPMLKKVKQPQQ